MSKLTDKIEALIEFNWAVQYDAPITGKQLHAALRSILADLREWEQSGAYRQAKREAYEFAAKVCIAHHGPDSLAVDNLRECAAAFSTEESTHE
jgi:hypothetical protein